MLIMSSIHENVRSSLSSPETPVPLSRRGLGTNITLLFFIAACLGSDLD